MSSQGPKSPSGGGPSVPLDQRQRDQMKSESDLSDSSAAAAPSTSVAPLREDLIEKAVGFLTHAKVQDTPLSRKKDFLREKKGMTDVEIAEAVRRAGVSDTSAVSSVQQPTYSPLSSRGAPFPPPPPVYVPPPQQQEGYGLATVVAGAAALAGLGMAGAYVVNKYTQRRLEPTEKPSKKSAKKKRGEADAEVTPIQSARAVSGKKKDKGKGKEEESSGSGGELESVRDRHGKNDGDAEFKKMIMEAFDAQGEQNAKAFSEIEKLVQQIEENNKLKFDLLRSSSTGEDSALRNDVQTIKQLLLTRQMSTSALSLSTAPNSAALVAPAPIASTPSTTTTTTPSLEKDEGSPVSAASEEGRLVAAEASQQLQQPSTPAPVAEQLALSGSTNGSTPAAAAGGLKPWEHRRRARIENASVASTPTTPATASTPATTPATSSTTTATTSSSIMEEI